ncbi:CDP-alcohol phosphatidyltransferase family protein [bacterium]|nr:CDP-alcohol phosphatidyltransferase family protein [bacterium]MBR6244808.1 CDP-alcohol phosphatidyltransferase family protein [bacterium]
MNLKDRWMKLRNYQSDDFWAMLFARPLTILLLLPIAEKPWLTPDRITLAGVLVKFAGIFFVFYDKSYLGAVLGAVLLNIGLIVDNMDGTLARFRNTPTKFGYYFDKTSDCVTMVPMFWALAYRGWLETQDQFTLILPLLAAATIYIAAYSKWVYEKVFLELKLSEKFYKNEIVEFVANMQKCPKWSTPPQRGFTDWVKFFIQAIVSILKFNEVDVFFWVGLTLITGKYIIFTVYSGLLVCGIFAPFVFGWKILKKEKEINALRDQVEKQS